MINFETLTSEHKLFYSFLFDVEWLSDSLLFWFMLNPRDTTLKWETNEHKCSHSLIKVLESLNDFKEYLQLISLCKQNHRVLTNRITRKKSLFRSSISETEKNIRLNRKLFSHR